ncbi:MAG: ATP-binding protein [Bacteroidales bacterium]
MIIKPFFNYRTFIWVLLVLAILMGGVFLVIAYTYNLQKDTEKYIESTRNNVNVAREMENELTAIKGLSYVYLVNKSNSWLDSLRDRQSTFIIFLEQARISANTYDEELLIQQISALFSNYEQNILLAVSNLKNGEVSKANVLLVHSAQELLGTIQQKSNEFITLNKNAEYLHESEMARTNVLILKILVSLGIGGIASGLLFGWLLSRMLFGPINQLVLKVRGSSGEAFLEHFKFSHGNELDELGESIKDLINRINQANADLSRNKELLQYSNKFANLGKIAPTIAHEIRNPLAAIKMLVYSIKEDAKTSGSFKEELDIISGEIDRIDNFTKDFLKFAKPADPIFYDIIPSDTLGEVIQLLKPRLKNNSIHLINNSAKCKFHVLADASHLKQIYLNLILNAVEVMPAGGELTIDASEVIEADLNKQGELRKFIRMDFSDSGPGIPEAIMKTLFEPFIKGSDMGVGIGLSISQSIAESHGGKITAENKPDGSGAIFRLYLPLITT